MSLNNLCNSLMKFVNYTSRKISLLFILLTSFSFQGCRYEDGPWISLRSASARVEGTYDIVKFEVRGADSTLSIISQPCYARITFDGGEDREIYFKGLPVSCLTNGTWDLTNNGNYITLAFNGRFTGIPPFGTGGTTGYVSAKYNILKLTDHEIKISTTYNNLNYLIELEE